MNNKMMNLMILQKNKLKNIYIYVYILYLYILIFINNVLLFNKFIDF